MMQRGNAHSGDLRELLHPFIINMLFIPSMTQAIFGGTAGMADSVSKVGGAVASIAMMAG